MRMCRPADTTEAVIWAAGEGIVEGTSEGIFRPEKMVTREQLATILYRYSGESAVEEDVLAGYPDGEKVSTFAKEGMNWAVSKGLITGVANGTVTTLNPRGAATRAQIATILMRSWKINIFPWGRPVSRPAPLFIHHTCEKYRFGA